MQCWARDGSTEGQKNARKRLPIEQKESFKWIHSYRQVAEAQRLCPDTLLVNAREATLGNSAAARHVADIGARIEGLAAHHRRDVLTAGQTLLVDGGISTGATRALVSSPPPAGEG